MVAAQVLIFKYSNITGADRLGTIEREVRSRRRAEAPRSAEAYPANIAGHGKGIDPGDDFVVVERYTHVCHHFRKADEDEDTHRSDGPTRPPVGWLSVGRLVRHAPIAVIKDDISTNPSPRYEPRPSDKWDLGWM
ncbi:hypothetical protein Q1695_008349 [Nippostrongylus brasiliensis]|nr:hypothetical protein Q1695_008349 [Nippostrongylus brasiliensis]